MIDDPLSLVLWLSWLMAAGMYPVGFLFGTCSACCQQCPDECSKCTHYADNAYSCTGLDDVIETLTYSVVGYASVTINNPSPEPSAGCGNNSVAIPIQDLPQGNNQYIAFGGKPCLLPSSLTVSPAVDACGCEVCNVEVTIGAYVQMENDGSLVLQKVFSAAMKECGDTTLALLSANGFQIISDDNVPDAAQVAAWFNALSISVSVTLPECDCGACCDDGCEENVAEGGCNTWQGVGVDCDPDPCV